MRLKELRLKHNLTQKQVAKELGVSLSSYANYERGRTRFSAITLCKLIYFYNVSADYIAELTDDPTSHFDANDVPYEFSIKLY